MSTIPGLFVIVIIGLVITAVAVVAFIYFSRKDKQHKASEEARKAERLARRQEQPALSGMSSNSYQRISYDDEESSSGSSRWEFPAAISFLIMAIVGVLTVVALICSMLTSVPPKSVGVVTSFGKPDRPLGNGLHLKAPWEMVTDLDGTQQTNRYEGDNRITVRLADQSEAYVNASSQWELKTEGATDLYSSYRGSEDDITESIRSKLMEVQLKEALNRAFNDFDPLSSISEDGETDTATLSDVANEAEEHLLEKLREIGGGEEQLRLIGITVPNIEYTAETQNRIDAYRNEVAKTRVAEQQVKTNGKLAEANDKIAASIRDNPEILIHNCLQTWGEKGDSTIPVQCFGANGDATAVKMVE